MNAAGQRVVRAEVEGNKGLRRLPMRIIGAWLQNPPGIEACWIAYVALAGAFLKAINLQ